MPGAKLAGHRDPAENCGALLICCVDESHVEVTS